MKSVVFLAAAFLAAVEALPEGSQNKSAKLAGRADAKGVQKPKVAPQIGVTTSQGCYKSSGDLKFVDTPQFNSLGGCGTDTCGAAGYAVGGTTDGNQCWCGNTYPRKSDLIADTDCSFYCSGYDVEACGGPDGAFSIYNTGKTLNVKYVAEDESSSKSSSTSTPTSTPIATTTSTQSPASTTASETPTSEPESDKKSSTNVAGIAAGVVVGVVVIAALIGGGFFYMRRKRNREIEEEHRRNAAVNAFIGKSPGSSAGSMADSRMDPVLAHRRMSDGSIADNQDYSRRILRVTNA